MDITVLQVLSLNAKSSLYSFFYVEEKDGRLTFTCRGGIRSIYDNTRDVTLDVDGTLCMMSHDGREVFYYKEKITGLEQLQIAIEKSYQNEVDWIKGDPLEIPFKRSRDMSKPKKRSKKAIKRGMALPGMQSHINRLKASWRTPAPSDEVTERWIQHRVVKMIGAELLRIKTTMQMIDMYEGLITLED